MRLDAALFWRRQILRAPRAWECRSARICAESGHFYPMLCDVCIDGMHGSRKRQAVAKRQGCRDATDSGPSLRIDRNLKNRRHSHAFEGCRHVCKAANEGLPAGGTVSFEVAADAGDAQVNLLDGGCCSQSKLGC